MKATLMYGAGDVRVEDVPDPGLVKPTDALVRITGSCYSEGLVRLGRLDHGGAELLAGLDDGTTITISPTT